MKHRILIRHGYRCQAQMPIALLSLLLSPAAATAAQKSEPRALPHPAVNESLVVFVRPPVKHSNVHTNFIFVIRRFVATLDNDCYAHAVIEPGDVLVWSHSLQRPVRVNLQAEQIYLVTVAWDRVVTVEQSTLDETRGVTESVGAFCEPTAQETKTAQKYLDELFLGNLFLWDKACANCKRIKIARKIGEWPRVDLSSYSKLEIEVIVTSKKAQKTERLRELALRTENQFPERVENLLESGVFQDIEIAKNGAPGDALLLRVDFPRYYGGKVLSSDVRLVRYVDFEVTLIDSSQNQELARF